jgi:hypothetical protein
LAVEGRGKGEGGRREKGEGRGEREREGRGEREEEEGKNAGWIEKDEGCQRRRGTEGEERKSKILGP